MQKRDSHVYPAYKLRWNQLNVLMILNFESLVESIYLINLISPYVLRLTAYFDEKNPI